VSGRFIVTGGAGFIGSNLVAALNSRGEKNIVIVDRLNHEAKRRNIAGLEFRSFEDKDEFRRRVLAGAADRADTVFHLGACSSTTETNEAYLMDNNTQYSMDLCRWCRGNGTRFIYASSAATYGDGSNGYSDDPRLIPTLRPLNLYGLSKQRFDMWVVEQGLLGEVAGLKYFNVYGPREDHKGDMRSVVNKAYAQVLEAGEITLFRSHRPGWRDGEQERDFVFVRDAVNVALHFHDNPGVGGIYNCGTGAARTWLDLARAVFDAMGVPPRIRFTDMPEVIRDKYQYHTCAETDRLRGAGYSAPFTSIEDGVADYVRGYLAVSRK